MDQVRDLMGILLFPLRFYHFLFLMTRKFLFYGCVAVLCFMILMVPVLAEQTTYQMNEARTGLTDEPLTVNIAKSASDMDTYIMNLPDANMWSTIRNMANMMPGMENSFFSAEILTKYSTITSEVKSRILAGQSEDDVINYIRSQKDSFSSGGVISKDSVTFSELFPAVVLGPEPPPAQATYHTEIPEMGAVGSTPVLADGKVYFVTSPTENETLVDDKIGVYCVNIAGNRIEWSNCDISDGGISGLTLVGGKLYLGSLSGKLYCLNADNGNIIWSSEKIDQTVTTGLSSTPLVLGDTVYVTTQMPAALWAFSADTGTEIYNNTVENAGSCVAPLSSPSTDGSRIFSAGAYGISAYDPNSQTDVWTFPLNELAGTPVYANDNIFFGTKSSLYSINATTGEQNWQNSHNGYATSPAIKGETLVANGPDGLTAYNTETSSILWTHKPHANEVQNLIGAGRLSKEDTTITVSQNSPIIVGNMAFYTANIMDGYMSGCVYGVNLTDGKEPEETASDGATVRDDTGGVFHPFTGAVFNGPITTSSPAVSYNLLFIGTGSSKENIVGQEPSLADGLIGLGAPGMFTKYFYSGSVTIPPSLSTNVQGTSVPYATPLGLLAGAAAEKSQSFTFSGSMITAYNEIANNATHIWRMQINGAAASDITAAINNGDRVLFYYGPTDKTGDALYAVQITADITDTFAEITFSSDYKRAFTPGDTDTETLSAVITDWQGKTLTPGADEISWTTSNDAAFKIVPNGNSLSYTKTGNVGDTAVFTVTYTPNAGASVSAQTEPISIYNRIVPIPSNPAIETTQTYFTWKGNYARTGVANGDGPTTSGIFWDVELPVIQKSGSSYISLVEGSPVVHNGRVYVSVWNGGMAPEGLRVGVFCFDAQTGNEIWNNPSYQSRSGMTVFEDKLYVSGGASLVCLSLTDGSLIWKTPDISIYPSVGLTGTPVIYNGIAYINTVTLSGNNIYNYLYGFDAQNGKQIVKISSQAKDGGNGGAGMFSSPSMSPDGVLYVPGAGGVYAVDTKTNAKLWEFDSGARSTKIQGAVTINGGNNMYVSSPIYKDQCVYFIRGGNDQTPTSLYCINAVTGEQIRKYDIQSAPITPVITDDKIITLGAILNDPSSKGGVSAYNLTTGNLLWHYETGGTSRASPIVAGDIVYFGTYNEGTLYAIDINTGEEVWHYKLPDAKGIVGWWNIIEGTPAIENGVLYVGGENGHFYAFKTDDKTPFKITGSKTLDAGVEGTFTTDIGRPYNWDFGDETKTAGTYIAVKKIWKTAGTYTVTASSGTNKAEFTVTVTEPPKAFSESEAYKDPSSVTQATITAVMPTPTPTSGQASVPSQDVTTNPGTNVSLTFSTKVLDSPTGTATPIVVVVEYQTVTTTDAKVTLDLQKYTVPPNTEKAIFLMNVSDVQNVKQTDTGQGHRLEVMAKLVVNLTVTKDTAGKISFWRYSENDPDPIPLQSSFNFIPNTAGPITVTYTIYVPGFSTIVATVDKTAAPVIEPPKENTGGGTGGGGSSASLNSLSYTNVNPGTGDFEYTTTDGTKYTVNGMTAFGVLNAAGLSLETKTWPGGIYVNAINGLVQDANLNGWMYQVNGYAPMVMSNSYPVSYGDKVVWYYSDSKMSTDPAKSKKYYAFTVSTAVSATGGGASGQTTDQTTKPGTIVSTIPPAETKQIKVTIPDGIKVEKLDIGQKITIDTAITKLTGTVSINARNIIIIQPGIQITIPLADVVYNGDVATATIRGMTAEIVPVPVTVPKGGYSL